MRTSLLRSALVFVCLLAACGGGDDPVAADTNIVDAGSFRVELPDEIVIAEDDSDQTETATGTASDSEEAAASEAEPTPDEEAIPLQDDANAVTGLFDAFDDFQECLERKGTQFLGVPDPNIPETTDPTYIAELTSCAAESGILEAQRSLDAAAAERTLEEREIWNENILLFADCLRGQGWTVAEPEPDAYGSLQLGGDTGGTGIEAPPGEDALDNPTVRECAAEAVRAAEAATAENG